MEKGFIYGVGVGAGDNPPAPSGHPPFTQGGQEWKRRQATNSRSSIRLSSSISSVRSVSTSALYTSPCA